MVYRGLYAKDLQHLNSTAPLTGKNVRRMYHLTQLQHVRPGGGIHMRGLLSRNDRKQTVIPSQSWIDDGNGIYGSNSIAAGYNQAQGGTTGGSSHAQGQPGGVRGSERRRAERGPYGVAVVGRK